MSRPLALDFFCCAGGITVGLERAGFDVIGFDWKPNPHWCGQGPVHQADLSTADAIEGIIRAFAPDFVTASPPCQRFSDATPTENREGHADLIASTREGITRTGVPAWIENVASSRVPFTGWWVMLCGSMFPEMYHLKRHRRFELIGWTIPQPRHNEVLCRYGSDEHDATTCALCADFGASPGRRVAVAVAGNGPQGGLDRKREVVTLSDGSGLRGAGRDGALKRARTCVGVFGGALDGPGQLLGQNRTGPECIRWREAMGWLDGPRDRYSLAQAIPPAYGEWLGREFLRTRA